MTLSDLINVLNRISCEYVYSLDDSSHCISLIRYDILCMLPKLISMNRDSIAYICFRPMGFECDFSLSRLQDNPLVKRSSSRSTWKVCAHGDGRYSIFKLID